MSFTSRPPFTGGMSNQNQQQQQGGQPNNANIGASGIPNMPMINNAASIPGNHLANPSGSSGMSVIDQKIFQQQLLLQRQLLMHQQQQQQPSQQNQQAKFQQPPQSLNRIVSDILNDKNGGNVAAQQTQLQHIVQLQALTNMMQLQQQAAKSFQQQQQQQQQQSVPLPTNTTITPVARSNMQSMSKQPVNYPRSNAQNKNLAQNPLSSSPMQSRKSFPNAPKSTVPPMQSGLVATPLNISSSSSKSTLPQMPSAMTSAGNKGYADLLAASLNNSQASMNITPSLTITKTNSPSGSYVKNSNQMPNRPVSSPSSQKSFLPEAISMSLGNVPLSVKTSHPPSVTVTPTNKPTVSPTSKPIPNTPLKLNSPQNVPGLQKLSPTSPRTKQTPRKNTNPIRTTSLSPATQTSSQTAVPHIDVKSAMPQPTIPINPSVSISPSAVKVTSPNANSTKPAVTAAKPPTLNVVPTTPPKGNISISVAPATHAPTKPVQSTPVSNSTNVDAKQSVSTPKTSNVQPVKIEVKAEKTEKVDSIKVENIKTEKTIETVKTEKPLSTSVSSAGSTNQQQNKAIESKSKQNASQNDSLTQSSTNQSETTKETDKKEAIKAKPSIKMTIDKSTKSSQPATPVALTPIGSKIKRNRFKTIPYQSPTPEIELVSKISAAEAINAHKKKTKTKNGEDKLTLFYKNEFLAVRNTDGGFFLCQTMYNVYKTSPKIRIRWLSEGATEKNIYCLDYMDTTDIECVLTSVSLNKLAKGKFELTSAEHERIESILKKALDVENGIVERPDVTEENPDGLDLSLYKDESQIEKKTSVKRKANEKADVKTTTPITNKRKSEIANKPKTNSAKNSLVKKTDSGDESQSTPGIKRVATKRKLADETNDEQNQDASLKDATESKDVEPPAKMAKIDGETPRQSTGEKTSESVDNLAQSSRATRRNKN
ncbi:transcriptional regulator of filamentous growth FLO8-like isoform X2 [Contarinia nasturtii]|nr:transcriptional regulator of filamentous growth FLO8-like isoform X2 [Contarinia nasturtii]XP_031636657.1 transcriptional regulator of filamentous growth FLO8-like isoform X2 [Contarinia nasturtii]XP_031636658.1 transcriptional regulator of filamentous growth FLO8-like isoform X2 [Contarinia nasturtii]XP_031636659.1 transcriptional regulator of filamentous growth FLO8-like isoform X2 [Contarinia nasturtii]XP_031636660.1 transcriptional regulator of filamentous growth FLO8-like isoform X2 [Co